MAQVAAETGKKVRRGRVPNRPSPMPRANSVALNTVKALKPTGNTPLRDFGRVIRNEPHKYIFTLKYYMVEHTVPYEPFMDFLRERYVANQKRSANHGCRYEVHKYEGKDGNLYVNYVFLERLSEQEKDDIILNFGDITTNRVERDGKPRRLRLKKEERLDLDEIIDQFYLDIEKKRMAERLANGG